MIKGTANIMNSRPAMFHSLVKTKSRLKIHSGASENESKDQLIIKLGIILQF